MANIVLISLGHFYLPYNRFEKYFVILQFGEGGMKTLLLLFPDI